MGSELLSQVINNPVLGNIGSYTGAGFFQRLLPALVAGGLIIGVIIFFFMLLIGAIQWITSGGDKGAVETARGRITNAIIGLVILLSLFAITQLLGTFFGIDILRLDLSPLSISSSTSGNGNNGNGDTGNANCPCSADLGGGCASIGAIAIGPASECYRCTSSGWSGPIGGSCSPISCSSCP